MGTNMMVDARSPPSGEESQGPSGKFSHLYQGRTFTDIVQQGSRQVSKFLRHGISSFSDSNR